MSVPVTSVYSRMLGEGLSAENVKHYLRHAKGQRNQARNYARRRWTWNIEDDLR